MITPFSFKETEIKGLIEVTPFNADDVRGCFTKDYSKEIFAANGIDYNLVEVFYTKSLKGTVRGLHFQRVKQQQKLIRCISGHIFDVVVDLRKNSHTFKKWIAFELTESNKKEILVPVGCAHGFMALKDSIVSYKCDERFYKEYDDGIIWKDMDIGISWPIDLIGGEDKVITSDKDRNLQSFNEFMDRYGGF